MKATTNMPRFAADRVPEYVLLNAAPFFTCRECGKVYWYGSHIKSIDAQLKIILGEIAAHWKTSEKD
ncbi:MAG: hypothetical protein HQL08_04875 [Nitrospirae bacterium]|nr:hypothetical protein [Nitrospirota bacterium]